MAALVQSLPQSATTVTMLQPRPSSSSAAFQAGGQNQQRAAGGARNGYPGGNLPSYRGPTSSTPVAPYAFTSTPALTPPQHTIGPFLRQESRTSSAPAGPVTTSNQSFPNKSRQLAPSPMPSEVPTDASSRFSILSQPLDLTLSDPRTASANAAKPSPERYRRAHRRSETSSAALGGQAASGSAMPSGSGMATVGHLYNFPTQSISSPAFASPANAAMVSKDDSAINQSSDQAKRYRRRSMATMNNEAAPKLESQPQPPQPIRSYASVLSTPYKPQKPELPPVALASRPDFSSRRADSDQSSASSKSSRPSSVSESLSLHLIVRR